MDKQQDVQPAEVEANSFACCGITVHLQFSPDGPSLEHCIKNYLLQLKQA